MAGIGIDGLISTLDTSAIIDALLKLERRPISLIQTRQTNDNNRITALQTINANLLALSVAAGRLGEPSVFSSVAATSSRPSIADATASSNASPGTYVVNVLQLARAEQFASARFASSSDPLGLTGEFLVNGIAIRVTAQDTLQDIATRMNAVTGVNASVVRLTEGDYRISVSAARTGAGTIDVREVGGGTVLQALGMITGVTSLAHEVQGGFRSGALAGRLNPAGALLNLSSVVSGTFTINDGAGTDVLVSVDLSTDSLTAIATKIQDAADAAGADLSARVVEVNGRFQLEVASAAGVTVEEDPDGILQTLGVLRSGYANQTADQVGRDARFQVNGLEFVRSANVVTDAIPNVTLTLYDDSSPTTNAVITVASRTQDVSQQVQALVAAFNAARSYITQVTRYDTTSKEAGILLGDSTVRNLVANIAEALQTRVPLVLGEPLSNLNSGAGVSPGRIRITNASGGTQEVNLTQATTVQDVVDTINRSAARVRASVAVRTVANPDFDPNRPEGADNRRVVERAVLVLTDLSGGNGAIRVDEVGGGRTAEDLGLLGEGQPGRELVGSGISSVTGTISLTDIGVRLTDTGTLAFDSSALAIQLNRNPAAVRTLFAADGVGVSDKLVERLGFVTHASRGTIATRIEGLRAAIEADDKAIERIEKRVELVEERLRRQFTQLETTLAKLQQTGTFVTQQLQNLNSVFNRYNNRN